MKKQECLAGRFVYKVRFKKKYRVPFSALFILRGANLSCCFPHRSFKTFSSSPEPNLESSSSDVSLVLFLKIIFI